MVVHLLSFEDMEDSGYVVSHVYLNRDVAIKDATNIATSLLEEGESLRVVSHDNWYCLVFNTAGDSVSVRTYQVEETPQYAK